ncbi:hypothetical protein [Desulfonatronum thiodismutans]|uniref:hypothetical protein n=1 Tax=Desulfonatronum thiodismutans TaxID=159290 RepID=UPI0004ABEB1B|nr:hypothetical protein [Desulfonatronum thiodismutans]
MSRYRGRYRRWIAWLFFSGGLFLCSPGLSGANYQEQLCPSQVLVLYNADWRSSHPLIEAGQDSLTVAEHYVRMRTDPASGEKPYLLGLSCKRLLESLLAGDHLEEKSSDNSCGVVYQPPGARRPASACEMRDSRLVEVILPDSEIPWDLGTLRLWLEPESGTGRSEVLLVEHGRSLHPGQVQVQEQLQQQGDWQVRAHGRVFLDGQFTARAQCQDEQGSLHEWSAKYSDFEHAFFSATGPDGVRDDQNYLDCVEEPVKAFLEDPANARPDGTLLKDHILYFVVAYGLPRTVQAPYGIASGINDKLRDHGSFIDLGQRLQIMYYDVDRLHSEQVQPMRFTPLRSSSEPLFSDTFFRTPLARPLWGPGTNPFVHPRLYQKDKAEVRPPRFTANQRAFHPERHLYFSMRIDGVNAVEAMELVDRAVYGSSFAGPEMGVLPGVELLEDPERTGEITSGSQAEAFWNSGYRHLLQHSRGWVVLELFRLAPGTGFFNSGVVFLPGGIATHVQSSQGWNMRNSRFHEYLQQGVTITAGAARVGGGAPHIHNHSFWDEGVLYPFLRQGYPVGEILLMNQIHMAWLTSFVGDPLYRLPNDSPRPPDLPELDWEQNVTVKSIRNPEIGNGYLVMADLESTPEEPRVAQMRLSRQGQGENEGEAYVFERFSSRPFVLIPRSEGRAGGDWILELIDPFGNRSSMKGHLN